MEKKISIIVPVYNGERFIDLCVNSIINQTYKNLEIILVDDGSKDNSGRICDELSDKYSNIKVIHTENKRQGNARNVGVKNSSGEYIFFLDSDDLIRKDCLSTMFKAIKEYQADIVVCGVFRSKEGKEINWPKDTDNVIIMDRYQALKSYVDGTVYCSHLPCNKLYKRELFNNAEFVTDKYYEDLCSVYKFVGNAKKVVYIEKYFYCYIDNLNSTMHKSFGKTAFDKIWGYDSLKRYLEKEYKDLANLVDGWILGAIMYCVGETYKRKLKVELKEELKYAKGVAKTIDNKNLNFKQKICLFLVKRTPYLFGLLYRVKK